VIRGPRAGAVLAGAMASGALLLAACGATGSKPADGDLGDRRLHQLAADPIFGRRAPRAVRADLKLTPAADQPPGFGSGGWSGPGVTLTFTSAASPESVYAFYGHSAQADGWSPAATGSLHVPDRWRKTYPNGARGTLTIFTPRPFEATTGPREYRLSAGISLPS
jgi:hypothetical protein